MIAGLARTHTADIEAAHGAVKDAARPRIHTFISTSDIHITHQLQTTREDVKGQARAAVAHARSLVRGRRVLARWTPRGPTWSSPPRSARSRSTRARPRSTSPTPWATRCPTSSTAFLEQLYGRAPDLRDVVLSVHCHDDLGLAVANSFAGLLAGARQVECAVNGIGERAGNASLEEIVMLLHDAPPDVGLHTGVVTTELARTSRMVSRLTGYVVQPNKAIVGAQRVRARVRHPPGRRPEGAHDLRDHGRDDRGPRRQLDRPGQALRAPRAAAGARGAGLPGVRAGAQPGLQALQGDRGQEEAGHRDGSRGPRDRRAARRARRVHAGVVRRRGVLAPARPTPPSASAPPRGRRSAGRSPATARSTRSSTPSTPRPGWT